MRFACLFSALALLVAAPSSHADVIRTFQLNLPNTNITPAGGSSVMPEILDGSVTINVTNGELVSAAVFDDAGAFNFYADTILSKGYNYPPTPPTGGGGGGNPIFLQPIPLSYGVNLYDPNTNSRFDLVLDTISLFDYNGGTICASGCALSGYVPYNFAGHTVMLLASGTTRAGTATLVSSTGDPSSPTTPSTAVTPEPSTLSLAGSGLLGLVAQLRRRKQMARAA